MSAVELLQRIKQAETTRKLDLSNLRLLDSDIPPDFYRLHQLRVLSFYRNQLKEVPGEKDVDRLEQCLLLLRLLCSLETCAVSLWENLQNLVELNLYRNRISSENWRAGQSPLALLALLLGPTTRSLADRNQSVEVPQSAESWQQQLRGDPREFFTARE